jgi:hypothetical protein
MCGVSVPGGRVRKLSTAVAELWRIPKKSHSHAFSESVEEDLQLLGPSAELLRTFSRSLSGSSQCSHYPWWRGADKQVRNNGDDVLCGSGLRHDRCIRPFAEFLGCPSAVEHERDVALIEPLAQRGDIGAAEGGAKNCRGIPQSIGFPGAHDLRQGHVYGKFQTGLFVRNSGRPVCRHRN